MANITISVISKKKKLKIFMKLKIWIDGIIHIILILTIGSILRAVKLTSATWSIFLILVVRPFHYKFFIF
jgi:hypothetical protein